MQSSTSAAWRPSGNRLNDTLAASAMSIVSRSARSQSTISERSGSRGAVGLSAISVLSAFDDVQHWRARRLGIALLQARPVRLCQLMRPQQVLQTLHQPDGPLRDGAVQCLFDQPDFFFGQFHQPIGVSDLLREPPYLAGFIARWSAAAV